MTRAATVLGVVALLAMPAVPAAAATKAACLAVAQPRRLPVSTFIDTEPGAPNGGRVAMIGVDNHRALQALAPPCPRGMRLDRVAMRTPSHDVLVGRLEFSNFTAYWFDTTSGITFTGESAAVSPDGRRVATLLVDNKTHASVIRLYDFATGRRLSDLTASPAYTSAKMVDGAGAMVLGFNWTPDSNSLVVAMGSGFNTAAGLFVAAHNAHRLPRQPAVPGSSGMAFWSPAVLANGHVLAFEELTPPQRSAYSVLVDVNLRTGAVRSIIGTSDYAPSVPACRTIPQGTSVTSGNTCVLGGAGSIDTQQNQALVTDGEGTVWLYKAATIRRLTKSYDHIAYW